ncbi:ECF transporter S component [Peptoniphilus sp. GNH]|nr:ECF transporter S component [Peptoniphilus sp. GNH]
MNNVNTNVRSKTIGLVKIAMLAGIGFLLMFIKMPLAFIAPPFMELDLAEVPTLIGTFAMGPVAGILIALVKNLIHLGVTHTMAVGELSNFIVSSAFALVAGIIYKRNKTYKGAVISLFAGIISMTLIACLSNYFVVFPLYGKFMGLDKIIAMGTQVTAKVSDLKTMMIYCVLPFNVIKGLAVSAVTILLYKKVSPILK